MFRLIPSIRVKCQRILVQILSPVYFVRADDDRGAGRNGQIGRRQWDIFFNLTCDHRHRRIQSNRFQNHMLQIVHLRGIVEGGGSTGIAENQFLLLEYALLQMWIAREQTQSETGAGGRRIVPFKHYRVDLFFDLVVGDIDAAICRFDHQIQKSQTILFARSVCQILGVVDDFLVSGLRLFRFAHFGIAFVHQIGVNEFRRDAILHTTLQFLLLAAKHLFGETVNRVDQFVVLLLYVQQIEN